MPKSKLLIGTSGWSYPYWKGIFYPSRLASKDKLKYFCRHFKTAEINYSFYHLPRLKNYQKWYLETGRNFLFAVKVSRFITHIKRLKGTKRPWKHFLENALILKEKLGPFLFQFPSNFKATEENIKRLKEFLKFAKNFQAGDKSAKMNRLPLRLAFEFRHKSWCDKKIYLLLKKYNCAWVIADSPSYPKVEAITADFVYIRMHGSKVIFSSNYTKKELKNLAQKIKKWLKKKLDIYVYFNNDALGFAVKNAKMLNRLL